MTSASACAAAATQPLLALSVCCLLAAATPASAGPASSFPIGYLPVDGAVVFSARSRTDPELEFPPREVWRTDGTADGTYELHLCAIDCSVSTSLATTAGVAFLITIDEQQIRRQLWRTDGTQAGTFLLADFEETVFEPDPAYFLWAASLGQAFFFVDGVGNGADLWVSDGTRPGTRRLGSFDAPPWAPPKLFEHSGAVYFFLPEVDTQSGAPEMWRTEGTVETTRRIVEIGGQRGISLAKGFVFESSEQTDEHRLWRSDGTAEGTQPLPFSGRLDFRSAMTPVDGRVWFWSPEGSGQALWTTDGSVAGTLNLGDFAATSTNPAPLRPFRWKGGIVFFVADRRGGAHSLWTSDGTLQGTRRIEDFCDGTTGARVCSGVSRLVHSTSDRFYVSAFNLWSSDDTPGGTARVADVQVVFGSPIRVVGKHLYFVGREAGEATGQLWSVDLQDGQARQLTNLPPSGGFERVLGDLGGRLLFSADDGVHGVEPWSSDGTPEGTRLIADVAAGEDGVASCVPKAEILCLHDNRFRVEVSWNDHRSGGSGRGRAIPAAASDASGYFWFFSPGNIELVVKILDGTSINGFYWTFYGALTDVEYEITVTDTIIGEQRTYRNPQGEICGKGDIESLPGADSELRAAAAGRQRALSLPGSTRRESVRRTAAVHPAESCFPRDENTLCLLDGRFRVRVEWQDQRSGAAGIAGAKRHGESSGFFWFFTPDNIELVVKALDARTVDGHFWFFYGALSDVGYRITVEDLVDGHRSREYVNPPGEICGRGDTAAFPG